ncbi:DUF2382 domain-containing protein [Methylomagnum sp.]
MNTVVGLIDSRSEVERVVHDLVSEGFPRERIHVVTGDAEPEETDSGFRGLLVKLGLLETQRKDLGLPAEHVGYYSEGVRRGGYLVTVDADEAKVEQAVDVLEDHGAVNIEERAAEWQKSGWSSATATSAVGPATRTGTSQPIGASQEARIPVVEEELKVGKRAVQRGGVRVYSHITERPASESIVLREEHVSVERHPVDRPLSGADMEAFKEGTIELTETAEEAVSAKEARVVEEVVVSKEATERTETIEDTVRRTDVEVEQLGAGTAQRAAAFEDYDADFRRHHSFYFANTGGAYDRYAPAYRYGYTLASNPAYAGKDWPTLEAGARRDWEKSHAGTGTWDSMKNAIHHAWERARGRG